MRIGYKSVETFKSKAKHLRNLMSLSSNPESLDLLALLSGYTNYREVLKTDSLTGTAVTSDELVKRLLLLRPGISPAHAKVVIDTLQLTSPSEPVTEKTEQAYSVHIENDLDSLRKDVAPLYCRYHSQNNPQPAHVEINPKRRNIFADYSGNIGNGVPMDVWHNRVIWYRVNECVKGSALADMLKSDVFLKLAEKIVDGYYEKFDGSNYNGHIKEGALDASEALQALLDTLDDHCTGVVDFNDFIGPVMRETDDGIEIGDTTITADTTDEEIESLAGELQDDARMLDSYIWNDVEEGLFGLRKKAKELRETYLTEQIEDVLNDDPEEGTPGAIIVSTVNSIMDAEKVSEMRAISILAERGPMAVLNTGVRPDAQPSAENSACDVLASQGWRISLPRTLSELIRLHRESDH